jgi:hypothetical protein
MPYHLTKTSVKPLLPQIPFYHLIVELALVLFILKILMSKSTGSPGDETPLTEKEMEVKCTLLSIYCSFYYYPFFHFGFMLWFYA